MKNVILEYGGSVIGVLGTIVFLGTLQAFFLGKGGFISMLILYVLGGL